MTRAPAEDLIARREARHVRADRFDAARQIDAADRIVLLAHQLPDRVDEEASVPGVPVERVDRRRMDPDQHPALGRDRPFDVPELQDVRRSGAVLHDRLHGPIRRRRGRDHHCSSCASEAAWQEAMKNS